MRGTFYKGFDIVAKPILVDSPTRWRVYIDISRDNAGMVHVRHFGAANSYRTEEEAIAACFEFGRNIIDGKVTEIPTSKLP